MPRAVRFLRLPAGLAKLSTVNFSIDDLLKTVGVLLVSYVITFSPVVIFLDFAQLCDKKLKHNRIFPKPQTTIPQCIVICCYVLSEGGGKVTFSVCVSVHTKVVPPIQVRTGAGATPHPGKVPGHRGVGGATPHPGQVPGQEEGWGGAAPQPGQDGVCPPSRSVKGQEGGNRGVPPILIRSQLRMGRGVPPTRTA